jgi:hypothetical protein
VLIAKYMFTLFKKLLFIIPMAVFIGAAQVQAFSAVLSASTVTIETKVERTLLGQQTMDLTNRYGNSFVSEVFRDNILLNLAYMSGKVQNASQINWDEVRAPSTYEFTLQPGEIFAFHEDVLPQYQGRVAKVTNAHFGAEEGFRSSGRLFGDGVCHFASIINWSARTAGLSVTAPSNHDFAVIPGIDRVYGTAIYYMFGTPEVNMQQNLYVENTFEYPVTFVFENTGDNLIVSVYK